MPFSKVPFYYILFLLMGIGPGWMVPMAIFLEIPAFQKILPEGLSLSANLNVICNLGIPGTFLYLLFHHRYSVSDKTVVGFLCIAEVVTCILLICSWNITFHHLSIGLYIGGFFGGAIGEASNAAVMAFMAEYDPVYISATRVGTYIATFFGTGLSAIQQPGKDHRLFDPTIFMIGFLIFASVSFPAYFYIISRKIGLKEESTNESLISPVINEESEEFPENRRTYDLFRRAFPLGFSVVWININSWGYQQAILPYAAKNASNSHDGSLLLQYIQQAALIANALGAFATTFFQCHKYSVMILVYTVCCVASIWAAVDASGIFWKHKIGAPLLIILVTISRFLDPYIITMAYRDVTLLFHGKDRNDVARTIGVITTGFKLLSVVAAAVVIHIASHK